MTVSRPPKKQRADGQVSGLAGELFVAAELLKRGLQTSVTFGNAKSIDLLAHNPRSGGNFTVQVKTLRKTNYFPIKPSAVGAQHIYVFVLLNAPGKPVEYFIVPGQILSQQQERFGKDFQHPTFPGIHPKSLKDFANAWHLFEQPSPMPANLASATLLAAFEGGTVHTAERAGEFLVIINQAALVDCLDPQDQEGIECAKVLTFASASSRRRYIAERGWADGSGL